MTKRLKIRGPQQVALHAVAAAALSVAAGQAGAFQVELGNPDLKMRWDNTVRYNLGKRIEAQDSRILASPS